MVNRAVLLVGMFWCGTALLAAESPLRQSSEPHNCVKILGQVAAMLDDWAATGQTDLANSFRPRLDLIRNYISGVGQLPAHDGAEMHAIAVGDGINAPAGVLSGRDRFAIGYAKANVTFTDRPIVITLSSRRPLYWDVVLAPGVSIKAVVLLHRSGQKSSVHGLPPGTLVSYERPTSDEFTFVSDRNDPHFVRYQDAAESASGMPLKTFQSIDHFDETLIIGPNSEAWRVEYAREAALALHNDVMARHNEDVLRQFAHLRFRATYLTGVATRNDPFFGTGTSTADFTLLGPIEGTVSSARYAILSPTMVPREAALFALKNNQLVVIAEGRGPVSVAVGRAVDDQRFTGLCYDEAGHRLLVAGTNKPFASHLYEYSFETNEWSELAAADGTLFGIIYDASNKRMLGLLQKPAPPEDTSRGRLEQNIYASGGVSLSLNDVPRMPIELVQLNRQGNLATIAELKLPYVIRTDNVLMNNGYQLVVADEHHAVLLTPPELHARKQHQAHLTLLDTETGRPLYTGTMRRHDATQLVLTPEPEPPIQGDGKLAEFWRQEAKVQQAIEQAAETDAQRASMLTDRLVEIQAELKGGGARSDKTQLHWIGLYEGPHATVRVTETRHPVDLVLTSYHAVSWTVQADEGVRLQRVLVASGENPIIASAPKDVPISVHSNKDGNDLGISVHDSTNADYGQAIVKLKEVTGLDVASFQGNYAGGEFQIGPTNASYLLQRATLALVQLEKDALAGGLSRQVDELESITFPAVYQEPLDATQMGAAALHMGRHSAIRYLAQFTLKGPIHGTLEATDVRSGDLIYDPAHPEVRYNFSRELTRVSAEGQSTPLPVDPQLPRADWPDSIALDTTRGRLLLTSHGGNGHLYAFDLTQESWSLMRTPGLGASAITYVPDEDAIYGVNLPMSEPVLDTLRRYTADGELVREVKIVPPIVLMDRGLRGDTAQLRYAAGHAFVITPRLLKSAGPANEPSRVTLTSWIHVIKAASGEVVYEGKLAIHAGRRQLSSEQLHDLWENANLDDLDNVAWAIASAQNAAVAFLAGRFSELRSGYDAAAVDQLIAQLDDERFRVRMEASNGLKSIGRQIQPQIERHLESEDDLSGEVKARLRELIDAWQNDAPLSAQEKRDTLAVLALQRIGTQEALAVLREQAQGPNWAIRTSQAKAALAELESRE